MSIFRKWYWEAAIRVALVLIPAALLLGLKGFLQVLVAPLPLFAGIWTIHWLTRKHRSNTTDEPDTPPSRSEKDHRNPPT